MGKKSGNVNTKVLAANEKKAAAQLIKNEKKAKEIEKNLEKEWNEGANIRGARRKEEEEKKKQLQDAQKAEIARLKQLEEEFSSKIKIEKSSVKKAKSNKKTVDKPWELAIAPAVKKNAKGRTPFNPVVSSQQNATNNVKENRKTKCTGSISSSDDDEIKLLPASNETKGICFEQELEIKENRNRQINNEAEATNIDDAIGILDSKSSKEERHPEKRVKAAYKEFEAIMLPKLKEDFPKLKLSQYKQKLADLWRKCPENPINQQNLAYNSKR